MTFEIFKKLIPKIRKMSVPGSSSHLIMAPEIRKNALYKTNISKQGSRNSAVMMLFYPKNKEAHICLILRAVYEGVHSGQIGLPGGKAEKFDLTYEDTALRETWEEIGVAKDNITVVKKLTKIYVATSKFWIHPFIGFTCEKPDFVLQKKEVAKVIEVSIKELLNKNTIAYKKLSTSYAKKIEVPAFILDGYTVWGATAMMLSELKVLLQNATAV